MKKLCVYIEASSGMESSPVTASGPAGSQQEYNVGRIVVGLRGVKLKGARQAQLKACALLITRTYIFVYVLFCVDIAVSLGHVDVYMYEEFLANLSFNSKLIAPCATASRVLLSF